MQPQADEPAAASAQKVFICYRREETAAHAGRVYDAMVARFGERNVFMDIDLAPGVDFVEHITEVVSGCLALIVVIGPSWATVEDEDGDLRIADPADFVRLEVETGLRRPDVTPIPLLVGGARMPRAEDLPAELRPLARRNALELSDARWSYDVGRLMTTLDRLLPDETVPGAAIPPQPTQPSGVAPARMLVEGVLIAAATAYLARRLGQQITMPDGDANKIAGIVLRRAETWALTATAVAIWLGLRTKRTSLLPRAIVALLVGAIAGALGGAILALPSYLLDLDSETRSWIDVGAQAVTGGVIGGLIGSLWDPPQRSTGLAAGLVGGVLIQLLLVVTGWDGQPDQLVMCLQATAIVGLALATLLSANRVAVGDVTRPAERPKARV